jgi:sulfite reductase alpha subunit-like flavoprotein
VDGVDEPCSLYPAHRASAPERTFDVLRRPDIFTCYRQNTLFAGSESGARTWAILATLINTAKLNDLDPHTYLADVLERMISGRTPVNRLDELLAWNWKAARATMATAA